VSLKVYRVGCCDPEKDRDIVGESPRDHAYKCGRCNKKLHWIPEFGRLRGDGWFKPGFDIGLGEWIESPDHRERVMKEKHCVSTEGGGDINRSEPDSRYAIEHTNLMREHADKFGYKRRP
jgi:hypothetical protein